MKPLENNLEAMSRKAPRLAEALGAAPRPRGVKIRPCRNGSPALWVLQEGGALVPAYDLSDPAERARAELQDTAFRAEDATLLIGFGLGYHVEEIARCMEPDHQVFVVEPELGMLREALAARDLRHLILHERIHFFGGTELSDLKEALRFHLLRIVGGHLNEFYLDPLEKAFPEAYARVKDRLEKILWHLRYSYRHLMDNGTLRENLVKNIPALCRAADAADLRGRLAGTPAVVVAAGPSLDRAMRHLHEFAHSACLVAVDTALKPLLENGLAPHFVVSVDPWEQNFAKFDALAEIPPVPLIFEPGVYHRIPPLFPGLVFVTGSRNAFARWLLGLLGLGRFEAEMTSAAHLAFAAARHMGADPILFAGLDLSFPGESHHARGSAACWNPGEGADWVHVPSVRGKTVRTLPGFLAMIGLFEEEVALTQATCIQTTEEGARIHGALHLPLQEAVRSLKSTAPLALERFSVLTPKIRGPERASWLLQGLKGLLGQAQEVADLAQEAQPLLTLAKECLLEAKGFEGESSGAVERLLGLDRRLKMQKLFHEVLVDFHASLFLEQYRLGYKLKRASDPLESLRLSLQSLERSFAGCGAVARPLVKDIQGVLPELLRKGGVQGPVHPHRESHSHR